MFEPLICSCRYEGIWQTRHTTCLRLIGTELRCHSCLLIITLLRQMNTKSCVSLANKFRVHEISSGSNHSDAPCINKFVYSKLDGTGMCTISRFQGSISGHTEYVEAPSLNPSPFFPLPIRYYNTYTCRWKPFLLSSQPSHLSHHTSQTRSKIPVMTPSLDTVNFNSPAFCSAELFPTWG